MFDNVVGYNEVLACVLYGIEGFSVGNNIWSQNF